jgi:hypothetical protein
MANTCSTCHHGNTEGSRFCVQCGASLSPQVHCPTCQSLNTAGHRFCAQCGGPLGQATWTPAATGGVVDGLWERGADEFVRKVEPEDARSFLGSRVVRVPPGSVGVVVVDGVIDQVLPPGERTSLSLFERIANFFRKSDRTAFYLVDQRPMPVPFIVSSRPNSEGKTTKTQVLATFYAPRGDRAGLGNFLANVVGVRAGYGAQDLYNLVRPEVVRIAQDVLERLETEAGLTYAEAEARLRVALEALITPRYGLTVDATVAPLTSIQSLSFHLGTGSAPKVRPCSQCRRELPVALKFCDGCGTRQATFVTGQAALSATTPLLCENGEAVELDLVVRVQGQHEDFAPERIVPALVGAAGAHLREVEFVRLATDTGFRSAEDAIREAVKKAIEAYGLTLVELQLVDVRSKTGEWLLAARADLKRIETDVALGREFLASREQELDLEGLTLAQALRAQSQRRKSELEASFAKDSALLEDRQRRTALAALETALKLGDAAREAEAQAELDRISRQTAQRREAEAREDLLRRDSTSREDVLRNQGRTREDAKTTQSFDHDLAREQQAHDLAMRSERTADDLAREAERARQTLDLEAQRLRQAATLEAERRKSQLELEGLAEAQQLDKLAKMAELDRKIAADEHAQTLEKRAQIAGLDPDAMIAIQAAELAKSGQGDAWAQVLAARAAADAESRHQKAMADTYERAMAAMAQVAASRAEAAPASNAPVVTVAQSSNTASTKPCKGCGTPLRSDATFCGQCGADQRKPA